MDFGTLLSVAQKNENNKQVTIYKYVYFLHFSVL